MTGLGFAGGALACVVTAIGAVAADRLSVHPAHARAVSDDEKGDAVTVSDAGARRLEAIRSLLIAVSAVTASALVYARIGWTAPLPAACCLCAAGPPLVATDLTEHRLPDKLTLPATAATAVLLITASWHVNDFAALGRSAIAAAAAAGFFLTLALITRQIGGGDVKLAVLTGMLPGWLGWNHFVLALLSGLLLASVTAALLIATRRISRRDPLPLGPFLLAGALIGVLA
ncbi:MAG: A24 family peptidase [Actinomycetota bacterium]|nr:A24 family peptidase [Actinomycetota bacterium]